MVMTQDYRLVEQGGNIFCNIKCNKCLPDLRRAAVCAQLAVARLN